MERQFLREQALPPGLYGNRPGNFVYRMHSAPVETISGADRMLALGTHPSDLSPRSRLAQICVTSLAELADHQIMTEQIGGNMGRNVRSRLTLSSAFDLHFAGRPAYGTDTLDPWFRQGEKTDEFSTPTIPLLAQVEVPRSEPLLTLGEHKRFDNGESGLVVTPAPDKVTWYYEHRTGMNRHGKFYRVNDLTRLEKEFKALVREADAKPDEYRDGMRDKHLQRLLEEKILSEDEVLNEQFKAFDEIGLMVSALAHGVNDQSVSTFYFKGEYLGHLDAWLDKVANEPTFGQDPRIQSHVRWLAWSMEQNMNRLPIGPEKVEIMNHLTPRIARMRLLAP